MTLGQNEQYHFGVHHPFYTYFLSQTHFFRMRPLLRHGERLIFDFANADQAHDRHDGRFNWYMGSVRLCGSCEVLSNSWPDCGG